MNQIICISKYKFLGALKVIHGNLPYNQECPPFLRKALSGIYIYIYIHFVTDDHLYEVKRLENS